MQTRIVDAHGHRFVHLSGEAPPELAPDAALVALVERFERSLRAFGLTLDDTVRTRLWARDADARAAASTARRSALGGSSRSSSSSYIDPGRFFTAARVALDLVAMHSAAGAVKTVVEYQPPIAPPEYVVSDGMIFCSGICPRVPTLAQAVQRACAELGASLERAGSGWGRAVRIGVYANRRYAPAEVHRLLHAAAPVAGITTAYTFVDGHAGADAHVEIEVTAVVSAG